MASELLLGVRLSPFDKMNVIKLSDINLKEKVEKLRAQTAGQTNLTTDSFDLIYCGNLLENDCTLESYGLKNGSMIHVLKKRETVETKASTTTADTEANTKTLTNVFRSFVGNPLLELAMRRLIKRPEVIENIISSSPGLSEDAVAIAILQDPDLIVHFTNSETIKRIAKRHPALLEAAQHIATAAVHDEVHNFGASSSSMNSSTLSNAQTTGHSYSLENLSDDEEMAGDSTLPTIAAQLLAELVGNESPPLAPIAPPPPRNNSNGGGVITLEMVYQAMQQAVASSPVPNDSANPPQFPPPSSSSSGAPQNTLPTNNMQRQIMIMHEMGLQNDAINVQALQITNGDVQAAIELVLSGFGDN